ncbi:MAG TPA: alpha/beta hydrolase [Terriglobales bacterium]|nr:alpha/beta hydrolase [Terriglobales bacterium]
MRKPRSSHETVQLVSALLVLGLATLVPAVFCQNAGPTPAAPQKTAAPSGRGDFFPPSMQSFPLYGDGAIPNSKPGPDEESAGPFIRKVSRPQIQVYLPAKMKANGAGLLIFPGGSYAGLTFDYEGTQQAQFFVDHGIAAFVVKYRIPSDQTMQDKSIGPLQDAQQAMRFVRLHATEWNLDAARIGAIGFSAGGHLASTLATHFSKAYVDNPDHISLRPDFLIVVYPVISMDAKITHMDSRKALLGPEPSEDQVRLFSNELQVTKDTPPTLILHAADDRLVDVDNSIVFFEALRRAGVPVEARFFQKGQHGFFLMPRDQWQTPILEWLTANGWLCPRAK